MIKCQLLKDFPANKKGWRWVSDLPSDKNIVSGSWYCNDYHVACERCRNISEKNVERIKVQYTYFVCQKCDFIGGNSDFSFIDDSCGGYDVDFHCPKCGSIDVKKRVGIISIKPPSMEIERLIRKSIRHKNENCLVGNVVKK